MTAHLTTHWLFLIRVRDPLPESLSQHGNAQSLLILIGDFLIRSLTGPRCLEADQHPLH